MNKPEELQKVRHSAAHLLAHAIMELYPDTQLTIGPATETGFFYDCLPSKNFKEVDLPLLQKRMEEIAQRNLPLGHKQIPKEEARKLYKDNPFKLELIDNLEGDTVGLATQGDFYDLCRGGHVEKTGDIKHFKLTGISGSYWRADRSGTALQRISGTAFLTDAAMKAQEQKEEEAQKYDHRRLGKQLDLFSFHDEGVGFPFFHPKGKLILNELRGAMRKRLQKAGYQEIETPTMLSDELWRRSGHYDFYKDNMYFSNIDEKSYAIKPMNCPGSIIIYKERPRSYRELPLRLNEFGKVHRHELSGVLHGLFRVRTFTIDDTHIYCTLDQIQDEILKSLGLLMETIQKCGFEKIKIGLSTKPEKAMGSDAIWEKATVALKNALDAAKVEYEINEGDGAFYGPKIDFRIEDSMEREWQCGTIQLDFFQPENFDLSYVDSDGKLKRPVIVHQAFHGSFERFFGILLEHHKGNLPFWLAPVQMKILTITDEQKPYAEKLLTFLQEQGIRIELNTSSDPLSAQIKDAQLQRVPWMLIIGKKEVEKESITLRYLNGKQEFGLSWQEVAKKAGELL
jgi:threonyl-tRNA synthetase